MRERDCNTCHWWDNEFFSTKDEISSEGICRLYPPAPSDLRSASPNKSDWSRRALFVVTDHDDWCGEWKAQGVPPKAPREIDLRDAGLPVRAVSALTAHNFRTLNEVASAGALSVLEFRNIGRTTYRAILDAMGRFGLVPVDRDRLMRRDLDILAAALMQAQGKAKDEPQGGQG